MRNYDFECVALQTDCSAQTKEFVETQWDQAIDRIDNWIRTVSIYLTDINGPRGGISKRCRIVVHTQSGAPVIVQDTQERISTAITHAIKRAAHTLKRQVAKKRSKKRQPLHAVIETLPELEAEV
ncbi:HPF/RaiA family ribosome-associated protein [Gimesia sp.]|uniref:HPF/RaiA family ribosome-associated protein n=1 Tax=Gimesia sp. TaxID=2024833 RepID=UPI003A902A55